MPHTPATTASCAQGARTPALLDITIGHALEQAAQQKLQTYGVVSQIALDRTAIDVDELKQQQGSEQENLQELTQLHQTRRAAFAAKVDVVATL